MHRFGGRSFAQRCTSPGHGAPPVDGLLGDVPAEHGRVEQPDAAVPEPPEDRELRVEAGHGPRVVLLEHVVEGAALQAVVVDAVAARRGEELPELGRALVRARGRRAQAPEAEEAQEYLMKLPVRFNKLAQRQAKSLAKKPREPKEWAWLNGRVV